MNIDAFSALYPKEVEQIKVIEKLPIPGTYPILQMGKVGVLKDVHKAYEGKIYGELAIQENGVIDNFAFINKMPPHSIYDSMILAFDDAIKSSVCDISETAVSIIFNTTHDYLHFIGNPENIHLFGLDGGYLHCCYNYDPYTRDRESGMSEKRFHLHWNYWTPQQLRDVNIRSFGTIQDLAWKRRLLDPLQFLGAQIAHDVLKGAVVGVPLMPIDHKRDLKLGLPVGLKMKFEDWSVLQNSLLVKIVRELHTHLYDTYWLITKAFTGLDRPPTEPWQRHLLLPREQIIQNIQKIDFLSSASKYGLSILADNLRDISPQLMNLFKKNKLTRIRHLVHAGPNYSLGLYSIKPNLVQQPLYQSGPVYLVLQTKMFSDIGGAGLCYMGALPIIRLARAEYPMTDEQAGMHHNFRTGVVSWFFDNLSKYPQASRLV